MPETPCPSGDKCLLLNKDFDRGCRVCQLCRQERPEEYAIQADYEGASSKVCKLHESTALNPLFAISQIKIYRLAGSNYYTEEAFSYKPEGPGGYRQINAKIANFIYGHSGKQEAKPDCIFKRYPAAWISLFVAMWVSGAVFLFG